ncbi:MAG TPA: YHYH protein, partial [Bacteroidia bacterium]
GDGVWNRDAIVAEMLGFDCSKGHPAGTNYHHHQNPSAFNLDLVVLSTVCNLYLADGLYVIDSTVHSPLIGFAYDGFPIYGAYGYKNASGTGGIVRMKSSYTLRSITTRTVYADGTNVTDGPNVSSSFPLGMYREDYQYNTTSAATPDYLDEHNGRFCVTPEYPAGIYCYFATVDANWNSYYPYVVGPTFYGVKTASTVTTLPTGLTTYTATSTDVSDATNENLKLRIYPNPANDVLLIQSNLGAKVNRTVELVDALGRVIQTQTLFQGSTMCYFDLQTVYAGMYIVRITNGDSVETSKVVISK